ncbi:CAP domain-containing protein [Lutibacter citreus]|uniref:CAP domain-containing protein n=1 Tax=Lutibacter citreus TaxID=2138210 RepID=UPI000DBE37D6|nr:CAP domain-containing protein [Lutibacter citreus]
MKRTLPLIGLCFIVISMFMSCTSDDENENLFNSTYEAKITYSPIENEVLSIVNDYRSNKGLNKLDRLNIISSVAETHSKYMAEKGIASHDHFSERNEELIDYANAKKVAENVAYGFSSSQDVVNAWLKSDEHRKIIENAEYTHFGISTKTDNEGRLYFTHIYIKQ